MEAQWSLVLFTVISGAGAWLFATSMAGALAKKSALPTKVETIVAIALLAVGGIVCCAAFFIYASAWLSGAQPGAVAWIAATFVCAAVALVAGVAAVKKAESATALGAATCIAGVICAIAMRVAMWLVGTPLLNFFLQPLD